VRALLLFRRIRIPVTHTGKLANIRNLPCLMFRHRGSVTFEMPCVYYTVYALRVCLCLETRGSFEARCKYSKVHSSMNSSFYQQQQVLNKWQQVREVKIISGLLTVKEE